MHKQPPIWSLYIIRTVTQTLYSGVTTDLERRFDQHQSNRGAKYLKGKGPLCLVYQVVVGDKSKALKLEYRLKQLTKQKKEQLVRDQPDLIKLEEDLLC